MSDRVKLTRGVLASVSARMNGSAGIKIELLLSLLGGVRATVAASQVMRA